MATHDYIISNASGAAVRSDLNNALAAIVSNNSSATEPATTYAYMWWADTTSGQLKLRNAANSDWVVLLELDGTTLMEDGTVSAPGLAFADDLNTGFYRPAADSLGIATNGAERVRIDSSGRLLTGTTSSLAMAGTESLLQVASSGAGASLSLRRDVNSADGPILIFGKSRSGSIGGSTVVASGDTYGLISFCGADGTDVNTAGAWIRSKADGTPGADDMPGRLEFYTTADGASTPTERMRIDSSGNVGIGTTSPAAALHVSASTAEIRLTDSDGAGAYSQFISGATGNLFIGADPGNTGSNSYTAFLIDNSEKMRIDSSGRLLVGTTSETAGVAASFQGSSSSASGPGIVSIKTGTTNPTSGNVLGYLQFRDAASSNGAQIIAVCDGNWASGDLPTRLVFSTTADGASSPTERMRITQKGGLVFAQGVAGNNFSTPAVNTTKIECDADVGHTILFNTSFGSARDALIWHYNSTRVGSIQQSTTSVSYNTSSDYRLKENVTAVTDGITRLQQLKPSRFNFIADPTKTVDGFLAHEVQDIVPEAITGTKDEVDENGDPVYQGIDQSKLVPLLTAALQEAIAKIETLEAKVAALESA